MPAANSLAGEHYTHWAAHDLGQFTGSDDPRPYQYVCAECMETWKATGQSGDAHYVKTGHTDYRRVRLRY